MHLYLCTAAARLSMASQASEGAWLARLLLSGRGGMRGSLLEQEYLGAQGAARWSQVAPLVPGGPRKAVILLGL